VADCGLPQLLIGQAIIPVIGCIRIGVIERPELVIGKCLIRSIHKNAILNVLKQKAVLSMITVATSTTALVEKLREISQSSIYGGVMPVPEKMLGGMGLPIGTIVTKILA